MVVCLQDGGRGRSAFREEEMDSLFRERHLYHFPGGAQRVRSGPLWEWEWRKLKTVSCHSKPQYDLQFTLTPFCYLRLSLCLSFRIGWRRASPCSRPSCRTPGSRSRPPSSSWTKQTCWMRKSYTLTWRPISPPSKVKHTLLFLRNATESWQETILMMS